MATFDYLCPQEAFVDSCLQYCALENEIETKAFSKCVNELNQLDLQSLNKRKANRLAMFYFDKSYWNSLSKTRKPQLKALFMAVLIRQRLLLKNNADLPTIPTLQNPELFNNLHAEEEKEEEEEEVLSLRRFTAAVLQLLEVIEGDRNQGLVLATGALIEGRKRPYKTGGAATLPTRRRLAIFSSLSGVSPTKKTKRTMSVGTVESTQSVPTTSTADSDSENDSAFESTTSSKKQRLMMSPEARQESMMQVPLSSSSYSTSIMTSGSLSTDQDTSSMSQDQDNIFEFLAIQHLEHSFEEIWNNN